MNIKFVYNLFKYIYLVLVFLFLCLSLYLVNDYVINVNYNRYKLFLSNNANIDNKNLDFEINSISYDSLVIYEVIPNGLNERYLWYSLLHIGDVLVLNNNDNLFVKRIVFINKTSDSIYLTLDNDVSYLNEKKLILSSSDNNMIIGKVKCEKTFIGKILAFMNDLKYYLIFLVFPLVSFIVFDIKYYLNLRRKNFEKS